MNAFPVATPVARVPPSKNGRPKITAEVVDIVYQKPKGFWVALPWVLGGTAAALFASIVIVLAL